MGKTDPPNLWKLIYFQSDQKRIIRKYILETLCLNPSLLPGLNFIPDFLFSPPSGMKGWGMGTAVTSSHTASASPSPSFVELPHSYPAPALGFSHGRESSMNFSYRSPSHGLQLFTICSVLDPFCGVYTE